MDLSVLAVPEDIKAVYGITAADFIGTDLLYAPENASIDWRSMVAGYYERLGIALTVSDDDAVVIRDKIFRLCMIAATIEIEGRVLSLCRKAQVSADMFPVRHIGGIRRYGKLSVEANHLLNQLLSREGLTPNQRRVILARYRNELPDLASPELLMVSCVMCLIEDTLHISSPMPLSA